MYIAVKETTTVRNNRTAVVPNNRNKVVFKNCAPFTDCISKIHDMQIDNAKDIDVVINIHNLIHLHLEVYGHTAKINQL